MSGRQLAPTVVGCREAGYADFMGFDYHSAFERRTDVCGGALVLKGTRVPVRTVLASLAEGASEAEIRADFPTVSADGLRAVIAFAATSASEDLPLPPVPAVVA